MIQLGLDLLAIPLKLYALSATAATLSAHGIPCQEIDSVGAAKKVEEGKVGLIITLGRENTHLAEGYALRRLAITNRICHATTASAASSLIQALRQKGEYSLVSLNQLIGEEVVC